jgi:hypothetical protein
MIQAIIMKKTIIYIIQTLFLSKMRIYILITIRIANQLQNILNILLKTKIKIKTKIIVIIKKSKLVIE